MRDCNKCIHHISGSCSAWECEMQTLEDYRNKIIDEFANRLCSKIKAEKNKEAAIREAIICNKRRIMRRK